MTRALAALEREREVVYAEPNFIYRAAAIPDDPDFGRMWSLHNSGAAVHGIPGGVDADIDAPEAWDVTAGSSSVKVGIADTGIRYDHVDLSPNVWVNPAGGRHGKDFLTDDGEPFDENGHGTHVAGIVGAKGGNGHGGAGVNWTTKLVALRVLDGEGSGAAGDIARAFEWAGQNGLKVVNASFSGPYSQAISDAVGSAPATLFVVSAGNQSTDVDIEPSDVYPCNLTHPNVICVAATDQRDELAPYSSYGPSSVDLAAPGTEVLSTYPEQRLAFRDGFESSLDGHWVMHDPTRWGRSQRVARSGSWSMSDSPSGPYPTHHEVVAESRNDLDLRGEPCHIEFFLDIDTGRDPDQLLIDYETAVSGWSPVWSGHGAPSPRRANVRWPLDDTQLDGYRMRVQFRSGQQIVRPSEGVEIDDLQVECLPADAGPNGEEILSGTSMAAPHATGVAALMWAVHPDWTVAQVRERMLGTVDRLEALAGKVATAGRLNAHGALTGRYTDPLPIGDRPVIDTVAGRAAGFAGDGGPATQARLRTPRDVAALPGGGFAVADTGNHRIRRVDPHGTITTIAGTGTAGHSGDGGPAAGAQFAWPASVSVDDAGGILVADALNRRIRRIASDGTVETVAGGGTGDSYEDGIAAVDARLDSPFSVSAIPGVGSIW